MLKFNSDGKFKIMQISDAQDLPLVRKSLVRMINRACDVLQPDLVLFTGDNILGNHINDAVIGTKQIASGHDATRARVELAIRHIVLPLEKRKIPFAVLYGNHDDMNCIEKAEQSEIYGSYSSCIGSGADIGAGCGTYDIPIMSSDGSKRAFTVWMLDSAGKYADGSRYTTVSRDKIDWMLRRNKEIQKDFGGLSSFVFQHVPIPETVRLIRECKRKPECIEHDGHFYELDPQKAHGTLGEYPDVCSENVGEFEALKEMGGVLAAVAGHDHLNCFEGKVDDIDIIQTACASFRCYGNEMRGVRLFELDERKPFEYSTRTVTYFDLFKKTPLSVMRYINDADDKEKLKYGILAGTAATAAIGALMIAVGKRK